MHRRHWRSLAGALGAISVLACASTRIGSPNDYEKVAMNRVVPYPSAEERSRQKVQVVLASRYTETLPKSELVAPMGQVERALERYLSEAGAGVIDRSMQDLTKLRADRASDGTPHPFADADYALVVRFDKWRVVSSYEPYSSLFMNEEEEAAEPGTCTHKGEVSLDLKVFAIPTDEVARTTFTLANSGSVEERTKDTSCPYAKASRDLQLEDILDEALGCLEIPVKNDFAPRGYVEEHRKSPTGDKHIFRTSLGSANGAAAGVGVVVVRVQHMKSADGRELREEREITTGKISDQIGADYSWITVNDPSPGEQILEGDLVRGRYESSLTARFGKCSSILARQGQ